jgi:hypothetical protein
MYVVFLPSLCLTFSSPDGDGLTLSAKAVSASAVLERGPLGVTLSPALMQNPRCFFGVWPSGVFSISASPRRRLDLAGFLGTGECRSATDICQSNSQYSVLMKIKCSMSLQIDKSFFFLLVYLIAHNHPGNPHKKILK